MLKCRCPKCGWGYSVPDDITGKTVRCQKCRSTLLAKSAGGKTILALAGVDGAAATQTIPPTADAEPFAFAPPGRPARSRGGWGVVAAFGGFAVLLLLIAGGTAWWRFRDSPVAIGRSLDTTPTREEFERRVRACKSADDLLRQLGRPDRTMPMGDNGEEWTYDKASRDPISGKTDASAVIRFSRTPFQTESVRYWPGY